MLLQSMCSCRTAATKYGATLLYDWLGERSQIAHRSANHLHHTVGTATVKVFLKCSFGGEVKVP